MSGEAGEMLWNRWNYVSAVVAVLVVAALAILVFLRPLFRSRPVPIIRVQKSYFNNYGRTIRYTVQFSNACRCTYTDIEPFGDLDICSMGDKSYWTIDGYDPPTARMRQEFEIVSELASRKADLDRLSYFHWDPDKKSAEYEDCTVQVLAPELSKCPHFRPLCE